jgi:hypothetical protein
MQDSLATYLHDHLAGSHFAIEILGSIEKQYPGDELAQFARALSVDVKQDQELLEQIIERVGKTRLDLMEAVGWLAEKASQLKLRRDDPGKGLGTFEALEMLTLGIRGKSALWKALPMIRAIDARIPDFDFDHLMTRAEEQFDRAEEQRLKVARITFGTMSTPAGA